MTIHHIALLKFKQGIAPADAEKVRTSLLALPSQIPSISSFKTGKRIQHRLDHGFDEGAIFVFKDEDAWKEYLSHKAHVDYKAFTAPYLQDKLIFDIHSED